MFYTCVNLLKVKKGSGEGREEKAEASDQPRQRLSRSELSCLASAEQEAEDFEQRERRESAHISFALAIPVKKIVLGK